MVFELKITYEPFKELVVKEYVRYDKLDDLVYIFAQARAAGQPVSLSWAEGVVFVHFPLPPDTDQLMDEYIKGRVYYSNVSFALMPEYKSLVTYKGPEGEIAVPITNAGYSKALCELAKWLKSQT